MKQGYWRSGEIWMAALAGFLMLFNAVRAYSNPVGFADYLGLPLADVKDAVLIHTYALRALFIGLLVTGLIWKRQITALALVAAIAIVMPIGDAVLAVQAQAAQATIIRHIVIALYLALTAYLLFKRQPVKA